MKKQFLGSLTRKKKESDLDFTKRTMDAVANLQLRFLEYGEVIFLQGKKIAAFWLKRRKE